MIGATTAVMAATTTGIDERVLTGDRSRRAHAIAGNTLPAMAFPFAMAARDATGRATWR